MFGRTDLPLIHNELRENDNIVIFSAAMNPKQLCPSVD